MRIALVSPLATPVRPKGCGSIEQIVWTLGSHLTAQGHDVTTFACGGSSVDGELVETVPGPYGADGTPGDWQTAELLNVTAAVERSGSFDVVHSHTYLWGALVERFARAPMLHTFHVMPTEDERRVIALLDRPRIVAISRFQWRALPDVEIATLIPHGVDERSFAFTPEPGDHLCWLGRFTPGKGPVAAIHTARRVGMPIRLAGLRNAYFDDAVAPYVDGRDVEYVGTVDGKDRSDLLGGARALLYSISEPEPFGLVMVEAMLCGTPVAAPAVGATPEIVEPGLTGALSAGIDTLAAAVSEAVTLDRHTVRMRATDRYSAAVMAHRYAEVYEACAVDAGAPR